MSEKNLIKELSELFNKNKNKKQFLKERNLLDENANDFAVCHNSNTLRNTGGKTVEENPTFVTFSACLVPLTKNLEIKNTKFFDWIEKNSNAQINDHSVNLIPKSKKIFDLDSITFNNDYNGRIFRYAEFIENGYVEHGFTFPLIYDIDDRAVLDLCRTTGRFWAFLIFIKKYFDWQKFNQTLEIRLIVHNCKELTISGFGGKNENGQYFAEPTGQWWDYDYPSTHRQNIEILKSIKIAELTTKNITKNTKEFSDKLAHTFNLDSSRCYNHDGTFGFDKFNPQND